LGHEWRGSVLVIAKIKIQNLLYVSEFFVPALKPGVLPKGVNLQRCLIVLVDVLCFIAFNYM
jgi:hypothetical protein